MKLFLIILAIAIIALIVWNILKTGRKVDQEKVGPYEVSLAADLDLDDSHKIGNVMRQTWDYFDANPGTNALTEIHSIDYDRACLITEKSDENGSRVVTVSFIIDDDYQLPDYPINAEGQPEVVFEGADARDKAEEIIKRVLELSDGSLVSYQLAGSDGPEHYFEVIQ